jgi:serine/threonine protein kinase/WD40 repeat protein
VKGTQPSRGQIRRFFEQITACFASFPDSGRSTAAFRRGCFRPDPSRKTSRGYVHRAGLSWARLSKERLSKERLVGGTVGRRNGWSEERLVKGTVGQRNGWSKERLVKGTVGQRNGWSKERVCDGAGCLRMPEASQPVAGAWSGSDTTGKLPPSLGILKGCQQGSLFDTGCPELLLGSDSSGGRAACTPAGCSGILLAQRGRFFCNGDAMQTWSITLHGPAGIIRTVDTGEAQFVIGTETATDVFTVSGEGVIARHAWLWMSDAGLQVEDLGGGTQVNGHQITERVQVEYPASVQVGELTLVMERKVVQPAAVVPTPSSLEITIPRRAVTGSNASMEVTIPQRTRTRSNVQKPAPTPSASAQTGSMDKASTLCEYTLVHEIARGGMGQIYFGEDAQLERQVAVKVSSISQEGEEPRFSKEAKVLAQLAHPNIVPIHNMGVDARGRPFYSMKLVKGRTLQAVLNLIRDGDVAAAKEYPRARLLTIFRKVCDAMMFAHSKGILHRDLKPENIMVGEYGEVLVMDWGLAKKLGQEEEHASALRGVGDPGDYGMTLEGEVVGTPQYMSPEQAEGMVAGLDQRSDIYSLGGILYAILTLRPPVEGTTLDEVLTKVKNGSISSMITKRGGKAAVTMGAPSAMGVEVPEALRAVTLKAMATNRDRRYPSVEAIAGDIERYQNGFATQAEDAGTFKKLVLLIKRNKTISAAATLLLVAGILFTIRLERERTRAVAALEESRRASAAAQMNLAEAAEDSGNSLVLKKALEEVPEDLRTPDWQYFRNRIETAAFTIAAPKNAFWSGLEDRPSDPEHMIGLLSSGEVFQVHLGSGSLQLLWMFEPGALIKRGPISVSRDGNLIALGFAQNGKSCISVRRVEDGTVVGLIEGIPTDWIEKIFLSADVCGTLRGVSQAKGKVEAWDSKTGRLLWEATGVDGGFSNDEKFAYLVNGSGTVEKRDPVSGQVILTGAPGAISFHPWILGNGMAANDWKTFFCARGIGSGIRRVDPWNGKVGFEIRPKHGNLASTWMPSGMFFATLGKTSPESGVVEIWGAASGALARVLPFVGNCDGLRLVAKSHAVVLRSRKELKIFHFSKTLPVAELNSGYRGARLGAAKRVLVPEAVPNGFQVWGFEGDGKKAVLAEKPAPSAVDVDASLDGRRCVVFAGGGGASAYRIEDSKVEEIWTKKMGFGYDSVAMHPHADLVWAGRRTFEFSSGRELAAVKNRKGLDRNFRSAVWVGLNRVAEISSLEQSSPDLSGAEGNLRQLALWDALTGELLSKTPALGAVVICASPDGEFVAEAGSDKRVRIRDGRTLEVWQDFRVHETELTGIAWHPRLPVIVTSAKDGLLRVSDTRTLQCLEQISTGPFGIFPAAGEHHRFRLEITADGSELNVYRDHKILVFRPESFQSQVPATP